MDADHVRANGRTNGQKDERLCDGGDEETRVIVFVSIRYICSYNTYKFMNENVGVPFLPFFPQLVPLPFSPPPTPLSGLSLSAVPIVKHTKPLRTGS